MILVDQKILVIKAQRWRATRHLPHRLLLVPRRVASHPLFALRWCISAVHITEDRKETGEMHDKTGCVLFYTYCFVLLAVVS